MWRPLLTERGLERREPATAAAIAAAERELGAGWPTGLRELPLETNGVFGDCGDAIVHPSEAIVRRRREMWPLDAEQLNVAFRPRAGLVPDAGTDRR